MGNSAEINLFVVVTAIVLTVTSTASQAATKNDINGFYPGMSSSDARANCNSLSGRIVQQSYDQKNAMCIASEGTYTLLFTTSLPPPPRLMLVLRQLTFSNSPIQPLIDSLSEQFNATPIPAEDLKDCHLMDLSRNTCRWNLDDGLVLFLVKEGLILTKPELAEAENEAFEKKRNSPPVPKF